MARFLRWPPWQAARGRALHQPEECAISFFHTNRDAAAALSQDLETVGAIVISNGEREEAPVRVDSSMRLCVSARVSDQDEIRSYRRWRGRKGGD